jgi:hypothetical protein
MPTERDLDSVVISSSNPLANAPPRKPPIRPGPPRPMKGEVVPKCLGKVGGNSVIPLSRCPFILD